MAEEDSKSIETTVDPGNRYNSDGAENSGDCERQPECAVCLQTCIHPVELPCHHIFCFLCVKGVANQSKRCALCRHEIPLDFLNNPRLLHRDELLSNPCFEDGYQWFYEGRNGWWLYDERTSADLEEKYKKGLKSFDILVAGFLYVVDLEHMFQSRRNDPTRRRKIKRDLASIPKKGVAGLKIGGDSETESRDGADGVEHESVDTALNARLGRVARSSGAGSDSVPPPPSNTPQSPNAGSPGRGSPLPEEALTASMSNLSLNTDQSPVTRQVVGVDNTHSTGQLARSRGVAGTHDLENEETSSESDWD